MKSDQHLKRVLAKRLKERNLDLDKLPVPDDIVKGDVIEITKPKLYFNKLNGDRIRYLDVGEELTYIGRKNNPKSNSSDWMYFKDSGEVKGLVFGIGLISAFKFKEEET